MELVEGLLKGSFFNSLKCASRERSDFEEEFAVVDEVDGVEVVEFVLFIPLAALL